MPVKTALREAGLFHLISGDPPPLVVSAYLLNNSGLLIAKYEREELGLDPYIFGSMLTAVGNFVKDSMQKMDNVEQTGGLNSLGFKDYKILIEESGELHLAIVTKGSFSEFLVSDMRCILSEILCKHSSALKEWDGDLERVGGIEPILSRLITSGKFDGRFLVDDPKIRQENLFDNVLLGFQRASTEKPLLLFLDDLQWADPTTLNLLHYISRNTRKNRVLMLGIYRPEDIVQAYDGQTHQLETAMQNMGREDLLDKVELKRLGRDATKAIIDSSLGNARFGPPFYDRIHKETDGTPFFVLEILNLLAEESAIEPDNSGAWTLVKELDKLDLPSKVYDVVKRRLDRLMKEQRKILDCASVVGEEFHSEVIGKAMGRDRFQLLENLSEIEKNHKLLHYLKDRYRFDHAKVREVLYNDMGEELRREYHRLIADTILELHKNDIASVLSELAAHLFHAKDERAGEYLVKAAEMAKERYANEEAIRLYTNALSIVGAQMHPRIRNSMGDIYELTGKCDQAINQHEIILNSTQDVDTKTEILIKLGGIYLNKPDYLKSAECLDMAEKLIGETDSVENAKLHIAKGNLYWRQFQHDEALTHIVKGTDILKNRADMEEEFGKAMLLLGNVFLRLFKFDDALSCYEKSLEIMKKVGNIRGLATVFNCIGLVHMDKGMSEQAQDYFQRSLEIMERIGDLDGIATAHTNISCICWYAGDSIGALEHLEKAKNLSEKTGDLEAMAINYNNLGEINNKLGNFDEALQFAHRSLELREKMNVGSVIAYSCNNIGAIYLEMEEYQTAAKWYERAKALSEKEGYIGGQINALISMAEISIRLNKLDDAEILCAKSEEISTKSNYMNYQGRSLEVCGILFSEKGDYANAEKKFTAAVLQYEKENSSIEIAETNYYWGLMCLAKEARAEGKEHIRKAGEVFEKTSMKLWADKCRTALEALE
jgi:tetratricopeptide (TPR) repeat protein